MADPVSLWGQSSQRQHRAGASARDFQGVSTLALGSGNPGLPRGEQMQRVAKGMQVLEGGTGCAWSGGGDDGGWK